MPNSVGVNDTDVIDPITRTLDTDSLTELGAEPVYPEIVRDLLRNQWGVPPTVAKPQIEVLNDTTHPNQGNLKLSDWLVVEMESIGETQRGYTYEFKDIEIPVVLSIYTIHSRQRLYNLMAEARRIIYKNHMAMRPIQMIYWDAFDETSDGLNRNWTGSCHIRLTSEGVPVFKGVVEGMGSPNLPEDQR